MKHLSKILIGSLILVSSIANGQEHRWVSSAHESGTPIAANSWLEVHDLEYNFVVSQQANFIDRFTYEKAEVQVVLRYDDTEREFNNVARTWVLEYELSTRSTSNVLISNIAGSLTIGDNIPNSGDYTDIHMNVEDDVIWAFLKITSIKLNGSAASSLPDDLYLDLIIDVERRYTLDVPEQPTFTAQNNSNNFLTFNWDYVEGATSYDLEWVYVENDDPGNPLVREYDMANATRINTAENKYTLPLAYAEGVILARIRAIGEFGADGTRLEGSWSGAAESAWTNTYTTSDLFYFYWSGLLTDMNWQYTGAYAEGGLRKDLINYFDGGLKSRQSLTLLNTDNTTVLSDQVYDHVGRPSLQLLPYPKIGHNIDFQMGQLGTGGSYFDKEDFDHNSNWNSAESSPPVGAGVFYSPANTGIGIHGNMAPSAQHLDVNNDPINLPYSRTLFLNDGSGRVKEASGTGEQHALGSGHTTTMLYGTPASQFELDRLFGSEVGYVNHYKKSATTDPNGVTSVTYSDQHGRTIATALAGDVPTAMEQLDTDDGSSVHIFSELTNFNDIINDELVVNNTFTITSPTTLDFSYTLAPEIFTYCLPGTCRYDLRICLYQNGSDSIDINTAYTDASLLHCIRELDIDEQSTAITFSFNITTPGSYTIEKVLSLNQQNLSDMHNSILNADYSQSVAPCPILVTVPPVPCDCETICDDTFVGIDANGNNVYYDQSGNIIVGGNYSNVQQFILDCKAACDPTLELDPCESKRQLLRHDMSPGGQYFDNTPDELLANGNANPTYDKDGWWDDYVPTNAGAFPITVGTTTFSDPDDLRTLWPSDPAEEDQLLDILISYHPEHCLFTLYCESECNAELGGNQLTGVAFYGPYYATMYGTDNIKPLPGVNSADLYYNPVNIATDANIGNPDTYQPFATTTTLSDIDELVLCWSDEDDIPSTNCPEESTVEWNLVNFLEVGTNQYVTIWYLLDDPHGIHTYANYTAANTALSATVGFTITQSIFDYFYTLHGDGTAAEALLWDKNTAGYDANTHLTPYQWFRSQYDFFREFYVYHGVQNTCLAENGCPSRIPTVNGGLYDADGFMVYYPTNAVFDNFTPGTGLDVSNLNTAVQTNTCSLACDPVVQEAVNGFELCLIEDNITYAPSDLETLYDDLMAVCSNSTDCPSFPTGTSQATVVITLPSGYLNSSSLAEAQSFEDVIDVHGLHFNVTPCNYPPAYPTFTNSPYDACPCGNIESLLISLGLTWNSTDATALATAIMDMDGQPAGYTIATLSTAISSWISICDGTSQTITDDLLAAGLIDMFQCPGIPSEPICGDDANQNALTASQMLNQQLIADFAMQYMADFAAHCLQEAMNNETFSMEYDLREYHYTLYYYDQAGNLIKTVPPAGVDLRFGQYMVDDGSSSPALPSPVYSSQSDLETAVALNRDDPSDPTLRPFIRPNHEMISWYNYNSFQQVHTVETPNGGQANSWYDEEGRIVVSQHEEQTGDDQYAYTRYDDLGRPTESGQLVDPVGSTDMYAMAKAQGSYSGFEDFYLNDASDHQQVTRTYYNSVLPKAGIFHSFTDGQQHLRNRVNTVTKLEKPDQFPLQDIDYDQASHYSYDIHGNVNELVQELVELHPIAQGYKKVDYEYDLISGNVLEVHYQDEQWDEFHHRYTYDADNRLLEVETSDDERVWERDARYFYYAHGPLARTELGAKDVHGADHYYTLQGWLKGVNSPSMDESNDPGSDGGLATSVDHHFARDNYSYALGYYENDFNPVQSSSVLPTVAGAYGTALSGRQLFNGNIQTMLTALNDNSGGALDLHGTTYSYDVLNRIRSQDVYSGAASSNLSALSSSNEYAAEFHFDANGNFWSLDRKEDNGNAMDELTYWYYHENGGSNVYDPNATNVDIGKYQPKRTDRLAYVVDDAGQVVGDDLEGHTGTNYNYDAIGRLERDAGEDINEVIWNLGNKIERVERTTNTPGAAPCMEFRYDPMGNRTVKIVKPLNTAGNKGDESTWLYDYYVRDAQGNPLAVYHRKFVAVSGTYDDEFMLDEQMLYGSDRLGTRTPDVTHSFNFSTTNSSNAIGETLITQNANYGTVNPIAHDPLLIRVLDKKRFELKNHLGNVLATISDRKVGIDDAANPGTVLNYRALQYSYSDYYPYGSLLPNRHETVGQGHRFAFQGQELDNEISGQGNSYTAQFWQYDPRVGRRWNVDPLTKPWESAYATFRGNPVFYVDPFGLQGDPHNGVSRRERKRANRFARKHSGYIHTYEDAKGRERYQVNYLIKGYLTKTGAYAEIGVKSFNTAATWVSNVVHSPEGNGASDWERKYLMGNSTQWAGLTLVDKKRGSEHGSESGNHDDHIKLSPDGVYLGEWDYNYAKAMFGDRSSAYRRFKETRQWQGKREIHPKHSKKFGGKMKGSSPSPFGRKNHQPLLQNSTAESTESNVQQAAIVIHRYSGSDRAGNVYHKYITSDGSEQYYFEGHPTAGGVGRHESVEKPLNAVEWTKFE